MRHIRFIALVLIVCIALGIAGAAFALPQAALPAPEESPLFGKVIGIDPGHQQTPDFRLEPLGPDSPRTKARMTPGATGVKTGAQEYQIALLISNKLKALLEDAGATVVMSRTTHDVSLSNAERAQLMNEAKVDCWLRIHCDYASDRDRSGIGMLAPSEDSNAAVADNSLAMAEALLTAMCQETGATRQSIVLSSGQTAFCWSSSPVVTIETGFLSNFTEETRLTRDSYQAALAKGIFFGLQAYFKEK